MRNRIISLMFVSAGTLFFLGCQDDVVDPGNLCGNGVLDAGEQCDGTEFADNAKVCAHPSLVIQDQTAFACNAYCQVDSSKACALPGNCESTCGNGRLDESAGEECDGDIFAESAKVCRYPGWKVLDAEAFACNQCQVDDSKACVDPETLCGDGKLSPFEACDGELINESAKTCSDGKTKVEGRELFTCNACEIDDTYACVEKQPALFFSEVVAHKMRQPTDTSDANLFYYIEIANLGADTPISDCQLVGLPLQPDNTFSEPAFSIPLVKENLILNNISSGSAPELLSNHIKDASTAVYNICYEDTKDYAKHFLSDWLNDLIERAGVLMIESPIQSDRIIRDYLERHPNDPNTCEILGGIVSSFHLAAENILKKCNADCAGDKGCEAACESDDSEYRKYKKYQPLISEVMVECLEWRVAQKYLNACDYFIKDTLKPLKVMEAEASRCAYDKSQIWGLGLKCGDSIYDTFPLNLTCRKPWNNYPTDRVGLNHVCSETDKLTSIQNSLDKPAPENSFESSTDNSSPDFATCIRFYIN